MTMMAEFRESRTFKLVADISVFHWFFTVIPGVISGVAASMHGKSLETVLAYLVGVSALAMAGVHYGSLAVARYRPRIAHETEKIPKSLSRLIIPFAALVVVLVAWFIQLPTKEQTGSSPKTDLRQDAHGGIQPSAAGTESPHVDQHRESATTTKRGHRKHQPLKLIPTTQPIPSTPTPIPTNSIIENAGQMVKVQVLGGEVAAPPGGSATILRTLPGSDTSDVKIENSHVSSAPMSTPGEGAAFHINATTNDAFVGNVACGVSTLVTGDGSNLAPTAKDNSVNDPRSCQWQLFVNEVEHHRNDIVSFTNKWSTTMNGAWETLPENTKSKYQIELQVIQQGLISSSEDAVKFDTFVWKLRWKVPTFDVKLP